MFKQSRIWQLGVAAAAALAFIGNAEADSVTAQLKQYKGGTINVSFGDTTVQGGAGIFLWQMQAETGDALGLAAGDDFVTFCIEAAEAVSLNQTHTYAAVDPAYAPNEGWPQMGADRANLLAAWYSAYYLGDSLSDWTNTEAMAFQMGVWEIVAETSLDFDLGDGHLRINNQSTARDLAQQWLDDASWMDTPITHKLVALTSPWDDVASQHIQDQIVAVNAVPAPPAVLAGLGLMGGLGFGRWVKRRRKA